MTSERGTEENEKRNATGMLCALRELKDLNARKVNKYTRDT